MNLIKVRIDFNINPDLDSNAKQVVFLEKTFEEIDVKNLIGKTIIETEYESFNNCLILTLSDNVAEYEIPGYGAASTASKTFDTHSLYVPNDEL